MLAEVKLAYQRLSILELAEALGNVSEACRQRGMTRTQFYEYKKRFQTHGLEGLKDLPPIHKSHPQWGCVKLSDLLRLRGVSVSSPTVQNILIKQVLGQKYDRLLEVERRHLEEGLELTAEQLAALEKNNPCFRERHVESSRPGELLSADTTSFGTLEGMGRVYLHTVVDTYGSYAFGYLHTTKQPEAAALLLHNDVLPFYRDRQLPVAAVLTDNGREFCGREMHPYELYLALNDIDHRRTPIRSPQTNGFVERFIRTVKEEFFELALRQTFYDSVAALQADLDAWLVHYNTERPHRGYRNMGRRPIDTVNLFQ